MTASTQQSENGRDELGKFAPGNNIGRGRPRREVETAYLQAFVDGCPADKLQRIVAQLAAKAEKGSIEAAKLLLRYAMPSHAMRVELAADEEQYRVAGKTPAQGMEDMLKRIAKKIKQRRDHEASLLAQESNKENH